jgi:hypothetical protein
LWHAGEAALKLATLESEGVDRLGRRWELRHGDEWIEASDGSGDGQERGRVVGERMATQAILLYDSSAIEFGNPFVLQHDSVAPPADCTSIVLEVSHDSVFRFRDPIVTLIDFSDSAERRVD